MAIMRWLSTETSPDTSSEKDGEDFDIDSLLEQGISRYFPFSKDTEKSHSDLRLIWIDD